MPKLDIVGAWASWYKAAIVSSLPFDLGTLICAKAVPAKKVWFAYSQVPIAMNHLVINGYKMTQNTACLRPGNKGYCGIVAGTIGNSMTYGMVSDKDSNFRELLELIE